MKSRKLKLAFALAVVAGLSGCSGPSSSTTAGSGAATTASDPSQAQIAWNADLGEQQGFYIEQSTDGVNFIQVATVPNGTNSATVSGLSPGHTYSFRVRAYNQSGDSPYSAIVAVSR